MNFSDYISHHYVQACTEQNKIKLDQDMINGLSNGSLNVDVVRKWMENYNLFQGIKSGDRNDISYTFLKFAEDQKKLTSVDQANIEAYYANLFEKLYDKVQRSWMSATSKLLWCIHPKDIAIYDSFVLRTLIVLQHFDEDLGFLPHLGFPPSINKVDDIKNLTKFYMQYQNMVKHLQTRHQLTLNNLRRQHNEQYPYDIRIVDKLLWMIGSGNKEFSNHQN